MRINLCSERLFVISLRLADYIAVVVNKSNWTLLLLFRLTFTDEVLENRYERRNKRSGFSGVRFLLRRKYHLADFV